MNKQYDIKVHHIARQLPTMMNKETFTSHSTSMHKTASARNGRQIDLSGAASGYGGGYCCDTGVDLPTLLALLAGISSIDGKILRYLSILSK